MIRRPGCFIASDCCLLERPNGRFFTRMGLDATVISHELLQHHKVLCAYMMQSPQKHTQKQLFTECVCDLWGMERCLQLVSHQEKTQPFQSAQMRLIATYGAPHAGRSVISDHNQFVRSSAKANGITA